MNGLSRSLLDTLGYLTGLGLVILGSVLEQPITISGGMGLIAATTGAAVLRAGKAGPDGDGDLGG